LLEDTSGEELYEILHYWFVEDPTSGSWDDVAEDLLQLIRSAEDGKHDMNTIDQMMVAIFGHSLETLQTTLQERKTCQ
jgi:N-acetylglucosamine kinase-like BadF-type ATPase